MLKLIVKQKMPNLWVARATVSGRCVRDDANEWIMGRTRKEAVKKLKTRLRNEAELMHRATHRVEDCFILAAEYVRQCK